MLLFNAFVTFSILSIVSSSLNAKLWQSTSEYVQAEDFPEFSLLASKPSTAIGFTGGGSRAYQAALGQLAALHSLDLIKNCRYIGGISGGAWATTTFSFAQNGVSDSDLLGKIVSPRNLNQKDLQTMDPKCARSLTNADLVGIALKSLSNSASNSLSDAWAYAVHQVYLAPVGIPKDVPFSWSKETVADIKLRNPSLHDTNFVLPTNINRPFPILGSTLVGPSEGAPYSVENQNYSMLEYTPLYVGNLRSQEITFAYSHGLKHKLQVGGAIEPFAFSRLGAAPKVGLSASATSAVLPVPEPDAILDVRYMAASSSYAPGTFFESFPLNVSDLGGLPMNYWSPSDRTPSTNSKMWLLSDGGAYENIPLINFLQRRVQKIVLFINAGQPLQPASNWDVVQDAPATTQISDVVSAFFGVLPPQAKWENRSYEYERDQVFATSEYHTLALALQAAQAQGSGIITTMDMVTVENRFWGIPAGVNAQVTWVYLGRVGQWEKQLSAEMHPLLVPKENAEDMSIDVSEGDFKNFPHYPTAGAGINSQKANVLADLTGWVVLQNEALFRKILS